MESQSPAMAESPVALLASSPSLPPSVADQQLAADPQSISPKELIKLNIGGFKYETTFETLTKRGPNDLSRMIMERRNRDPSLYHFFDRDGQYFAVLLEYLRNGQLVIPPGLSRASVEREAAFFGIQLPSVVVQQLATPQLRYDGIYIARVAKILPGFFLFGPENKFFHQTTSPVHNYVRMFSINHCVVQWTLGGLANEEQHALISHTGDIIAECSYSFLPFEDPLPGTTYRILSNKTGDALNLEIVDSLSDDSYKRVKFVHGGRTMPIGEITFLPKKQLVFKAVIHGRSTNEAFESEPITLEETTVAGVTVTRFMSEEFETGIGFMGTKLTRKFQIEIMCFGEFCLVRSLTMDLMKTTKVTKWMPSVETHFHEIFLMFPRARPKPIEAY